MVKQHDEERKGLFQCTILMSYAIMEGSQGEISVIQGKELMQMPWRSAAH